MMPRLQAEEAFAAAERLAIGTGSVEKGAAREITRRWTRTIEGGAARQTPIAKATPTALGVLGIGVRRVARKGVTS